MSVAASNILLKIPANYQSLVENENDFSFSLIPSAREKLAADISNIKSLTINDIKEECQKSRLDALEISKTNALFESLKQMTVLAIKSGASEKEKETFLNSEKNVPYFLDLKEQANKIVKIALEKFKNGAPFSVVINPVDPEASNAFSPNTALLGTERTVDNIISAAVANSKDSSLLEKIKLEQLLYNSVYNPTDEKKLDRRVDLLVKRFGRATEKKKKEYESSANECRDIQRYFLFICSKLNKDLDKTTQEELESQANQKAYLEFKERKLIQLERQRQLEIEKSFLPSQPQKSTQSKGHGKKTKNKRFSVAKQEKRTLEKSTLVPTIVSVSSPPIIFTSIFSQKTFFLDKRITRWFGASSSEIRLFADKVALTIVHHYQNLTIEELEEQRIYHSLSGVERLMSLSAENLQKYSTPYQFMHNGSMKNGRCFYANLKHGNITEEGMIYVGVDDKRIYHANFVPTSKKEVSSIEIQPLDLCLSLDGLDSLPNPSQDGEWEMEGGYTFKIENDFIFWSISNKKDTVEYQIEPLF